MTARPLSHSISAVVAIVFGLATVISGGRALFGGADMGAVVPFVLWFNFLAGFAYVAGAPNSCVLGSDGAMYVCQNGGTTGPWRAAEMTTPSSGTRAYSLSANVTWSTRFWETALMFVPYSMTT